MVLKSRSVVQRCLVPGVASMEVPPAGITMMVDRQHDRWSWGGAIG